MSTHWWRPVMMAIGAAAVAVIIVSTAYLLISVWQVVGQIDDATGQIADTQEASRRTQRASRLLLDAIQDCTKPSGDCYREQQARDAEQAGALNAAIIATRYCADRVLPETYTLRELTACVADILDGKGHQ